MRIIARSLPTWLLLGCTAAVFAQEPAAAGDTGTGTGTAIAAPPVVVAPPTPETSANHLASITEAGLFRHVRVLASDDFQGRRAGEEGGRLAATYMAQRFEQIGLVAKGTHEFEQPFSKGTKQMTNVVALLEGSDAELRDQYLVIGAHFDHLGQRGDKIYHGSDDNASGCAALIEVARALRADTDLRRSILFVAFDGEEIGLLGSKHFVREPPVPREAIVAMLNLDMVSRGETGDVWLSGAGYSPLLKEWVEAIAPETDLAVHHEHEKEWRQASDHGPFGDAGIPFLYFGVLDHEDYHKPTDTSDKANQEKMARIARLVYLTARTIANSAERPTYTE